jgi:hypothetical protein
MGTSLLAYQVKEVGLQLRSTVNLTKAALVINEKGSPLQPDAEKSIEASRNIVFPEEYEAYQCVQNGFCIRFANSEIIDFGADNAKEKETLLDVLNGIIGKQATVKKRATGIKSWCQIVLDKEQKGNAIAS